MRQTGLIDHLFRHEYGKLVAVLTRIFGLSHLETVEDAVQDTFAKATLAWREQIPDSPEAWLMRAARNRVVDLLRQIGTQKQHGNQAALLQPTAQQVDRMFLATEMEDAQLRMIFTACHPELQVSDQIAFALKTISGFSQKEIAAALLLKEETVKKRLQRARKTIVEQEIAFQVPTGSALEARRDNVLEVIHLIFNEGFHSARADQLVREELCGEALRLCRMLLEKIEIRSSQAYSLMALMCFHSARLQSKTSDDGMLIDLRQQDRSTWYKPLVSLGEQALDKALSFEEVSAFLCEAAIQREHHLAPKFEDTNWRMIAHWNEHLVRILPSALTQLNLVAVYIEAGKLEEAETLFAAISAEDLQQRIYLYTATHAELLIRKGKLSCALDTLESAIHQAPNAAEKAYLQEKRRHITSLN